MGVFAQQVNAARAVGIDAFMVSWWGSNDPTDIRPGDNNDGYIDVNFGNMLNSVPIGSNFKLAIMFESDMEEFHGKDVGAELGYLLSTHATHPNYLRHNGKPVVFLYNPGSALGAGGGDFSTWGLVIDFLRDNSLDAFYLADNFSNSSADTFDGLWIFGPVGDILNNQLGAAYSYGRSQAKKEPHPNNLWMPTIMAGYDDTQFRTPGMFLDRENCASTGISCFLLTGSEAMNSGPDWVHIGTWNEYHEATEFEESAEDGTEYLELIDYYFD